MSKSFESVQACKKYDINNLCAKGKKNHEHALYVLGGLKQLNYTNVQHSFAVHIVLILSSNKSTTLIQYK